MPAQAVAAWVATYNGDSNNKSVTSGTGLEPVTIAPSATDLAKTLISDSAGEGPGQALAQDAGSTFTTTAASSSTPERLALSAAGWQGRRQAAPRERDRRHRGSAPPRGILMLERILWLLVAPIVDRIGKYVADAVEGAIRWIIDEAVAAV